MQPGDQIGPFTIEKLLGAGAMGAVYRGVYNNTGRKVAIKIMLPGVAENKQAADRFRREVSLLKQFNHRNIVRLVYDDEHEGVLYYAMEYVQGESLDHTLGRRGRLSWEEVITLGQQLCDALQHAHEKGVIHRDLKPGNLMLLKDGTLKLTDFGIAKGLDLTQLTEANCTVGTASYMSPEQCRGERDLTFKSDLYSFGIVLYELLTGEKPFKADNVMDMFMMHVKGKFQRPLNLVPDLPKGLDILVCQLLEKKPEQRPRDAATVGQALIEVLEKIEARQSAGVEAALKKTTAVEDRAAARSLLGEKKKKKKKVTIPWHQKTWPKAVALLLALAGVGVAGWLILRPASADTLYERIEKRMASSDPNEWKSVHQGAIHEYLRRFGRQNDEKTLRVKVWNDQIGILEAESELTKSVAAAKKIDINKMDALTEAGRCAVRAAQMEEDGDLDGAGRQWNEIIREYPNDPDYWAAMARQRINVQLPGVRDLQAHLEKLHRTQAEDFPDDPVKFADDTERKAFTAFLYEKVVDKTEARQRWRELRDAIQSEPLLHVWFLLAASKYRELNTELKQADDKTKKSRQEIVKEYLKEAEQLKDKSKLNPARAHCRHIIDLYRSEKGFEEVVADAETLRGRIK